MSKKQHKGKPVKQDETTVFAAPTIKKTMSGNVYALLGGIVFVLSFLVYANTLNHEYVLDDFSQIKNNKLTKQGASAIPTLLKTSYRAGLDSGDDELYRPLSMVLFAALWSVSPDSPHLYHFVLVLLYSMLCYILFITLNKLFRSRYLALSFVATGLFMLHPLHTEVVANIKSADEVMGLMFFNLSLYCILNYIDSGKALQMVLALVSFFLAMLSKENMVIFTAVGPLILLLFRNFRSRSSLIAIAGLIPVAIIYLYIRSQILGNIGSFSVVQMDNALVAAKNYTEQFSSAVNIVGKNIWMCIFPHPLLVDYSYNQVPLVPPSNPGFLFSFVVCAALIIFALYLIVKKLKSKSDQPLEMAIALGILFFFIALFPTSNIILLIRCTMAERFLFLPSLGFCLAVSAVLYKLLNKNGQENKTFANFSNFYKNHSAFIILFAVIGLLYSFKTVTRAAQWKNEDILYTIDIKKAPNNAKLHYYYANHFVSNVKEGKVKGDSAMRMLEDAIAKARRSVELLPKYYESYFVLGQAYAEMNNYPEALNNYIQAWKMGYPGSLVLNNLGNAFFRMSQMETNPQIKMNMADSAIKYLQLGINYNPNNEQTWSNLGSAYIQKGLSFEAINAYNKALMINPEYTEAYTNLGSAYGLSKDYDKAIMSFQQALNRDPESATVNYYMGLTLQFKGENEKAKPYLEKAYQLNPGLRPAEKK